MLEEHHLVIDFCPNTIPSSSHPFQTLSRVPAGTAPYILDYSIVHLQFIPWDSTDSVTGVLMMCILKDLEVRIVSRQYLSAMPKVPGFPLVRTTKHTTKTCQIFFFQRYQIWNNWLQGGKGEEIGGEEGEEAIQHGESMMAKILCSHGLTLCQLTQLADCLWNTLRHLLL